MNKNRAHIKAGIKALATQEYNIIGGTMVAGSTDTDAGTISVQPADGRPAIDGILLSAVTENENGLVVYPSDDSDVIIASANGSGTWFLLKASTITKASIKIGTSSATITDGLVQFNDGSLGGLTKTQELKTQLDKTTTLLQHLVTTINGAPVPEAGSGAASGLQASLKAAIAADTLGEFSAIENTTIKQ